MKLNNHSYTHKQIRATCLWFEQLTGLKLLTNLSEEFVDIRFISPLSYVTVDFRNNTIFAMSIKLSEKELRLLKDLILYCNWLICGEEFQKIIDANKKNRC